MTSKRRGLADPHCHTLASDGMVTPAELVAGAVARGIDLIAVCDHDTMASAGEVQQRGEEAGLAVVSGQELTTRWPAQTHLLGWFLEKPVRSGMSLEDTVDAIHAQDGLVVIPHPFMPTFFASCQPAMLVRLLRTHRVEGVELLHTAPTSRHRQQALQRFYEQHQDLLGAAIGASDSHFGRYDLGRALTEFDGVSAQDFRRSVRDRTTKPVSGTRGRVPFGLLGRQQWRGLVELPLRRWRGTL